MLGNSTIYQLSIHNFLIFRTTIAFLGTIFCCVVCTGCRQNFDGSKTHNNELVIIASLNRKNRITSRVRLRLVQNVLYVTALKGYVVARVSMICVLRKTRVFILIIDITVPSDVLVHEYALVMLAVLYFDWHLKYSNCNMFREIYGI